MKPVVVARGPYSRVEHACSDFDPHTEVVREAERRLFALMTEQINRPLILPDGYIVEVVEPLPGAYDACEAAAAGDNAAIARATLGRWK